MVDRLSFDGHWGLLDTIPGFQSPDFFEDIIIYPNPAKNNFIVDISNKNFKTATISVMDIKGLVVYQSVLSAGQPRLSVDVSDLNSGIYFVAVLVNDKVFNKKIVLVK